MKSGETEGKPETVSDETRQSGDIRSRWKWVQPAIWTDRMLTTLEEGVKGGKWHSLIDKVYSERSLKEAFQKVKRNKGSAGVDHITIEMVDKRREEEITKIHTQLKENRYKPQGIRRVWIPKVGKRKEKRPLGIPSVRDRIVQTALRDAMEPIFEKEFAEHSYGFRPGRGCKDALRRVDHLLKNGYGWVVDIDLKSYFDTIPHDRLMEKIKAKISDQRVHQLIKMYLTQKVMESAREWTPEEGSPQGAVISPLLSNIYLDPLDKQMESKGYEMVRYADDMIVLCQTEAQASEALKEVEEWTRQAGLTLHPEKTRIVDANRKGGFNFLGYNFDRGYKWPCNKSKTKFKDKIRRETKRTNGHSMKRIIEQINPILRGWFEYFKHSRRSAHKVHDQWIRMRLRSILRIRQGKKGRGRGSDHKRWPNAYFADLGLLSLESAWVSARQSAKR